MKTYLLTVFFLVASLVNAQVFDPVSFKNEIKLVEGDIYELLITAHIENSWHLYSQNVDEGGPVPTTFIFKQIEGLKLLGGVLEPEGHTIQDPVFEMDIKYFEQEAVFKQEFELKDPKMPNLTYKVEYMVCNDTQCLPPETKSFSVSLSSSGQTQNSAGSSDTEVPVDNILKDLKPSEVVDASSASLGLLTIFILSFLGGFAALLTPCVFPMIPMTVSFFTKQSRTRSKGIKNALLYGLFIIVIYVVLGSVVTALFGADSLNALSTNVVFNLVFFGLLVFFACSFLGAFELVLPSSWATKIDSQADRGGFIGIFFMALALAIVSFSCTGPIVGTLLVESASKGGIAPIVGMLGFSLAIALPFALFAAFPGWLNSLPRSGGWLNTVKVVLGFLELAFAFKFLSNADLVLQLHLLERETFLAIWISIFGVLAFYLFGKITLPHDSPLQHISVGRLGLGLFILAFVIYMIPGLWGAPLQWISGFPPPSQYSESPYGVGSSKGGMAATVELPPNAELGPLDIITFKDYEMGMEYAKSEGKPVLLDFTGYACVNCRKMEERVWPDPQILQILKEDLVLISLYVDDKRKLPVNQQYKSETTGKQIKTIGNKWSDFQIRKYRANAQPYYVLVDTDGNQLNESTAYDPDIDSYLDWLQKGIKNFKTNN
tara:strand:+ start:8508 stop:10487 length:1980 start_codon:yes stop_codon:yes gene_type:complete